MKIEIEGGPFNAMELGRAAEHLVVADLILSGYRAFLTDQGLPYDVVIDHDGKLVRVQVKATISPGNVNANGNVERTAYTWHVRRRGKDRRGERLSAEHCDVVAAVALDIRTIAYLPLEVVGQTLQLSPPGAELRTKFKTGSQWGRTVDQFPVEEALAGDVSVYRAARRELTHCVNGHEYTPENTLITRQGYRTCRECVRASGRDRMRRLRASSKELRCE